jgi:hypothetical protein
MLQAKPGQGAMALVNVQFVPGGGRYPAEDEANEPDGYVMVGFTTSDSETDAVRVAHQRIVNIIGHWLTDRGVRWAYSLDGDGLWTAGHFSRPSDNQ